MGWIHHGLDLCVCQDYDSCGIPIINLENIIAVLWKIMLASMLSQTRSKPSGTFILTICTQPKDRKSLTVRLVALVVPVYMASW